MPFPLVPILTGIFGGASTFAQNQQQQANATTAWRRSVKQEQRIFDRDAAYNSPAAQMQRLKDAGLSPHLMYGQGTVGNITGHSVQAPVAQVQGYQGVPNQVMQAFALGKEMELKDKTIEVKDVQADVLRANPYLNKEYLDSVVKNMMGIASLKEQESSFMTNMGSRLKNTNGVSGEIEIAPRGYLKMEAELDELFNRLKLQNADLKTRAEIFQGKAFENALKEIQVRWMKDGDVTPQHVYQGIMLILQKLMTK